MKLRQTLAVLATAAATLAVATGCAQGPSEAAVAWVEKICDAYAPLVETVSKPPTINQADYVAGSKLFSDYLGASGAAAQNAIGGLEAAGPSPIPGGDDLVTKTKSALAQVQSTFASAKAALDSAPNTHSAKGAALLETRKSLEALRNIPNTSAEFQDNTELKSASELAPSCQRLKTGAPTTGR